MSGVNKYIDVDSSYRDRIAYPEVGDFVVKMNSNGGNVNAFNAIDPIALSFPYDTGRIQTTGALTGPYLGVDFLTFQLSPYARDQANFYVGSWINFPYYGTGDDWMFIIGYNSINKQIVTLNNPYGAGPYPSPTGNSDDNYLIRYELPEKLGPTQYTDTLGVSTNQLNVTLGALASTQDGYYVGSYLFLPPLSTTIYPFFYTSELYAYQWSLITAYTGATKQATLRDPLVATPAAGTPYQILPYSYDNYKSLQYYGTEVFNNPRCVNISLTNLTIPAYLPLMNRNGGFITDYPFVWVALYSENASTYQQPIISAAPASRESLFKCSLINLPATPYCNLSSIIGNQTVTFRINDDLHFKILLPDGQPVRFNPSYYEFFLGAFTYFPGLGFPIPPDPRSQVQATFNVSFNS